MSWLSRVRSGIPFLPKRQTSENLWHKCGKCGTMVFTKEWEDNLRVCPRCDHHDRIGWKPRFEQVFYKGQYELLAVPDVREDPLRFRDTKRYTDRIKTARSNTEVKDALQNAAAFDLAARSSECRTSRSWAGRWESRWERPSLRESARQSRIARPTSSSPRRVERACRKASSR